MNLEELEEDAGDEGETERKVYAFRYSLQLSSYGVTGASRRPMRLHEFQVSPLFSTEEGRRSINMQTPHTPAPRTASASATGVEQPPEHCHCQR